MCTQNIIDGMPTSRVIQHSAYFISQLMPIELYILCLGYSLQTPHSLSHPTDIFPNLTHNHNNTNTLESILDNILEQRTHMGPRRYLQLVESSLSQLNRQAVATIAQRDVHQAVILLSKVITFFKRIEYFSHSYFESRMCLTVCALMQGLVGECESMVQETLAEMNPPLPEIELSLRLIQSLVCSTNKNPMEKFHLVNSCEGLLRLYSQSQDKRYLKLVVIALIRLALLEGGYYAYQLQNITNNVLKDPTLMHTFTQISLPKASPIPGRSRQLDFLLSKMFPPTYIKEIQRVSLYSGYEKDGLDNLMVKNSVVNKIVSSNQKHFRKKLVQSIEKIRSTKKLKESEHLRTINSFHLSFHTSEMLKLTSKHQQAKTQYNTYKKKKASMMLSNFILLNIAVIMFKRNIRVVLGFYQNYINGTPVPFKVFKMKGKIFFRMTKFYKVVDVDLQHEIIDTDIHIMQHLPLNVLKLQGEQFVRAKHTFLEKIRAAITRILFKFRVTETLIERDSKVKTVQVTLEGNTYNMRLLRTVYMTESPYQLIERIDKSDEMKVRKLVFGIIEPNYQDIIIEQVVRKIYTPKMVETVIQLQQFLRKKKKRPRFYVGEQDIYFKCIKLTKTYIISLLKKPRTPHVILIESLLKKYDNYRIDGQTLCSCEYLYNTLKESRNEFNGDFSNALGLADAVLKILRAKSKMRMIFNIDILQRRRTFKKNLFLAKRISSIYYIDTEIKNGLFLTITAQGSSYSINIFSITHKLKVNAYIEANLDEVNYIRQYFKHLSQLMAVTAENRIKKKYFILKEEDIHVKPKKSKVRNTVNECRTKSKIVQFKMPETRKSRTLHI